MPFPPPGDLPDPGIGPRLPSLLHCHFLQTSCLPALWYGTLGSAFMCGSRLLPFPAGWPRPAYLAALCLSFLIWTNNDTHTPQEFSGGYTTKCKGVLSTPSPRRARSSCRPQWRHSSFSLPGQVLSLATCPLPTGAALLGGHQPSAAQMSFGFCSLPWALFSTLSSEFCFQHLAKSKK